MNRTANTRLLKNNFDLLRLIFASTVCLIHISRLSGSQQLSWISIVFSAEVATKGFFIVSGFLIFMSYERSTSLASYLAKRFRRIYPAYFTVVVLSALVLAAFSLKGLSQYLSNALWKYILSNLLFLNFLQPSLPGVFEANRVHAVNGALWTLKIEVMFYLSVPLFVALFRKFPRLSVMAITYGLSIAYSLFMEMMSQRTGHPMYTMLGRQLPAFLSYFMAGAFFYYYLPLFERRVALFMVPATAAVVANMLYPLPFIEPFGLAAVVVFFGLFIYLGNFGKYGDFSYGIYIVHFPIIQVFLQSGWFREAPILFLIVSLCATLLCAVGMWHLVEKRLLLRSSHYVSATGAAGKKAWVIEKHD